MFKQISVKELNSLLPHRDLILADVRDRESFICSHVPGAEHLSMDRLQQFCAQAKPSQSVVVYCYHGVTSQSVAQFLVEQGFDSVYSLEGGFEAWYAVSNKEQQSG